MKKQIFLFTLFCVLLAGIVLAVPALENIYGQKNFVDGLQSNGATVATLDANSKVPLANSYSTPPETTVELDDNETLTLPTITRGGILNVWTSTQYAEYFLKSDGSVEYIRMTSGCDDADTDVMTICVYDGGTNSILKNTSGGTLTYGYTLIKN